MNFCALIGDRTQISQIEFFFNKAIKLKREISISKEGVYFLNCFGMRNSIKYNKLKIYYFLPREKMIFNLDEYFGETYEI